MKSLILIGTLLFCRLSLAEDKNCLETFNDIVKESQISVFQDKSFQESLASTIVTSSSWLTVVQLLRNQGDLASLYSDSAFLFTVPIDIGLTLVSHAIILVNNPKINAFLSGKAFGSKFESLTRIISNTVLNTAIINASWLIGGLNFSTENLLNSFTLCLAVYSILQVIKPYLFKTLPQRLESKWIQKMMQDIPNLGLRLELAYFELVKNLNKNPETLQNTLLSYLSQQLLKRDLKNINFSDELIDKLDLANLLDKPSRKNNLRILKRVINSYDSGLLSSKEKKFIRDHFTLDNYLTWNEQLSIYKNVFGFMVDKKKFIFKASVVDQAIAVGLAGGIGLYYVNKLAIDNSRKLEQDNQEEIDEIRKDQSQNQ